MNIKFFEHLLGEKITIEARFILTSIFILFISYTPIYFSYFFGNMLLFNAVFFSQYFVRTPPTYFAYFLVGILADLRFDSVLGFYSFNFILFAIISRYVHEHIRLKKYYFLWALNAFFAFFLYSGEYFLNSLHAQHWFDVKYLLIKLLFVWAVYPGVMLLFTKTSDRLFKSNAS